MKKPTILFVFAFLCLTFFVSAQETRSNRLTDNWSLNMNAGASLFWGDLRQYKIYPVSNYESERNVAFGIILSKELNYIFELRGQFITGNLSGTRRASQTFFEAQFNEYTINGTLNFSRLFYRNHPDTKFNMYGIVGIGFVDYRTVKKELGSNNYIASRGYSGNGTVKEKMITETVIPFGFGGKFKIGSKFEINLENIWTIANTDEIDVSKGGYKYDILTYTSLGLTYKFSKPEKKKQINFEAPIVREIKQEPTEIIKVEPKAEEAVIIEKPKVLETIIVEEPTQIKSAEKAEPKVIEKPNLLDYEFKVQVFASNFKANKKFIQKYNLTEPIREDYNGILYRYSMGSFKTYEEAKTKAKKLINENKLSGAFVVGIKNDKRLDSFKYLLSTEEKKALKISPEK